MFIVIHDLKFHICNNLKRWCLNEDDLVMLSISFMLLRLCNWLHIDCRLVIFLALCYLLHLLRIKLMLLLSKIIIIII